MVLAVWLEVRRELERVVGSEYVSSDPEVTFLYHWDFVTAEEPGVCDIVVMPGSTREVQEVVRLANKWRIPVVPWVSGVNIGGLATPRRGGIVVDLRRMNRILEVNEDDMYAVVEGGTTWGDLKGHLERHHPDLRPGVPWAPAGAGVVPCYLCYGFTDLSFMAGTGADFLNGLEVVLPTGEVVRTGSCMCTSYWHSRAPLPDLTGLFVGWDGATGIVTKAGVKLWPNLPTEYLILLADTVRDGVEAFKRVARKCTGILDMCFVNYTWLMSLLGYHEKEEDPLDPEEAGVQDFYGLIAVAASSEREMEAKKEAIEEAAGTGVLADLEAVMELFPEEARPQGYALVNPPIHFYNCWNYSYGGGGEWVGCYLSSRHVASYYRIAVSVAKKYGRHAQMYGRVMSGGHHWIARVNISFNKDDPSDIEAARRCLMEIDEKVRQLPSVVRYKAPSWAKERNFSRASPDSLELIKRVRRLLDPNGVMNPGHGL
ncbi:MAG: hypothetical protein DRN96_08715 [Thermoproteota archaeon]|nr:MAG: hypothetical protein DRN96_08715 [Candidatus Korarchaeota archaeon]RLG55088.1 MAG: hypothetical protein DRN99_03700 [Candidatus Korarchaeota archaeon]